MVSGEVNWVGTATERQQRWLPLLDALVTESERGLDVCDNATQNVCVNLWLKPNYIILLHSLLLFFHFLFWLLLKFITIFYQIEKKKVITVWLVINRIH